jgi:hypothetical protein
LAGSTRSDDLYHLVIPKLSNNPTLDQLFDPAYQEQLISLMLVKDIKPAQNGPAEGKALFSFDDNYVNVILDNTARTVKPPVATMQVGVDTKAMGKVSDSFYTAVELNTATSGKIAYLNQGGTNNKFSSSILPADFQWDIRYTASRFEAGNHIVGVTRIPNARMGSGGKYGMGAGIGMLGSSVVPSYPFVGAIYWSSTYAIFQTAQPIPEFHDILVDLFSVLGISLLGVYIVNRRAGRRGR